MTDWTRRARLRSRWSLSCAVVSILWAGAALAQPAANPPAGDAAANDDTGVKAVRTGTGDIIVTARHYVPSGALTANKSAVPLIETPQSVSVVTRDQIDLLNLTDVQQAVRYTAGVTGENYGPDPRYDFLTVRGFTPIQFVDGVQAPITTTISNVGVDLYGFESVDILKGPSSILYGSVPPGGIYNMTSRRPSDHFGGEVGVRYGSYDFKQGEGTITGPLGGGFSARLTALYRDNDTEVKHVHNKRLFVAPAVTWKSGFGTTITALAYYQHDRLNGSTNGFLPIYGTLLPNPLGKIPRDANYGEPKYNFYRRNQFGAGFQVTQKLIPGVEFENNTKWFHYNELQHVIYGAGLLDSDFNGVPDDYRTLVRYNFPYKERVNEFATDNRISANVHTGDILHRILVGLDYRNTRNNAMFGFAGATSIDIFHPVYSNGPFVTPSFFPYVDARQKQTGVYVQDQAKWGGLVISLGGRYDWTETTNYLAASDRTAREHKFTYRVGANYVFANGIAPYIGYATSFQPIIGVDAITLRPFSPSTGRQIEGGIKYDARGLSPDVKLFATAAVYKIIQNNVVINAGSQVNTSIAAKQAKVTGVELEVVARIHEQLSLNASYSYTNAKISKTVPGGPPVGSQLPTQPKNKFSALADYTFRHGMLGGFGFGFGVRYLDGSWGSIIGPFNAVVYKTKATTLFDGSIHYDIPGWRFAVTGTNIFDKKYVGRCASASNCIYGQARMITGSITKRF